MAKAERNMTVVDPTGFTQINKDTKRLVILCILFTYAIGLLVRVPTYDDKLVGVIFSLTIDTIVVLLTIPYFKLLLRPFFTEINLVTFIVTFAASLICSTIIVTTATLIRHFFPIVANPYRPLAVFTYFTLLYCLWGMAAFWLKMQVKATTEAVNAANAARAAAISELKRLRMQLDPHFLFNSLNTALVEVNHQPKRAILMLRELSNYLRYSLDTADVHVVPVSAEVAMIRSFLRVQDIRFGAKLKYSIVAQEETKRRLVPTFLLQPLIENAVKYGIPDDDNVLHIDVVVALQNDDIVITVTNTGDLALTKPDQWGTRTGLSNFQNRLALHYPDRHSVEMTQSGPNVRVTCILKGEPC
jgi:two-component system, LytTR family, sensor kinase